MSLRVVTGRLKGRVIHAPPGIEPTRPTPGMVRQALFSILGEEVQVGAFCDLYAGTGSVAIEAISRGAPRATVVENNHKAYACLLKTRQDLAIEELELVKSNANTFKRPGSYHIAFADPPFAAITESLMDRCLELCRPGGLAIVQWPSDRPGTWPEGTDVRRYGSSMLVIVRKPETVAPASPG